MISNCSEKQTMFVSMYQHGENDGAQDSLIFPDLPPPPPPRKKLINVKNGPVFASTTDTINCKQEGSDTVSIDLITFDDDIRSENAAPDAIGFNCLGDSIGSKLNNQREENVLLTDVTETQITQTLEALRHNSQNLFCKDDLFKFSFDLHQNEATMDKLHFSIFSSEEGNMLHMNKNISMNPYIPSSEPGKQTYSSPKQWSHTNPFLSEILAERSQQYLVKNSAELNQNIHERNKADDIFQSLCDLSNNGDDTRYSDEAHFKDNDAVFSSNEGMNSEQKHYAVGGRSSQNPFQTEGADHVTQNHFPRSCGHCLQDYQEEKMISSINSKASDIQHEARWYGSDSEEYDDVIQFSRDTWPKVDVSMDMDPHKQRSFETEHSKCFIDGTSSEHTEDEKEDRLFHYQDIYQSFDNIYEETEQSKGNHDVENSTDDEEDIYIDIFTVRTGDTSRQYKVDGNDSGELQQEPQKTTNDVDKNSGLPNYRHPLLTSQRSLGDSAIYNSESFKDNKGTTVVKCKCSKMKGLKEALCKDNIKSKAKTFLSMLIKPKVKNPEKPSMSRVNKNTSLSCTCGGSCDRVGNFVTSIEGHVWISFLNCPWVSLYDHELHLLHKFDAHGIVDSLAVSLTNVLYISCPQKRSILMLSENLELNIMSQFSNMHPRGLAVSPTDGNVVACVTARAIGHEMDCPSKNCLMKFPGITKNEKGTVLNKGDFLGYPLKLAINVNGYILVSDFGLRCMFVLEQGGHMLKKLSLTSGGRPQCQIHSLTSGQGDSFYVVQGGRGKLTLTRLQEHQGNVIEKETSQRVNPDIHFKVRTSAIDSTGQLVVTSGSVVMYINLD